MPLAAWLETPQVMQLQESIAHGNDTVVSCRLMTGESQPLLVASCQQQTATVHNAMLGCSAHAWVCVYDHKHFFHNIQ